jgi:hypothetical protein
MCANLFGQDVVSPLWPNAIGRHYSGAIRWRIGEPGPETTAAPLPRSSPKNSRACCPQPAHPFPTDLVLPVRAAKTIYVRFDLNDYSIPPEAVGRQLTLVASDSLVRILEGSVEIARHPALARAR